MEGKVAKISFTHTAKLTLKRSASRIKKHYDRGGFPAERNSSACFEMVSSENRWLHAQQDELAALGRLHGLIAGVAACRWLPTRRLARPACSSAACDPAPTWIKQSCVGAASPSFRVMLRKPIKFLRRNDLQARSTIT